MKNTGNKALFLCVVLTLCVTGGGKVKQDNGNIGNTVLHPLKFSDTGGVFEKDNMERIVDYYYSICDAVFLHNGVNQSHGRFKNPLFIVGALIMAPVMVRLLVGKYSEI